MIVRRECDILIIGAGPGGLAAAKGAKEAGAANVIVLDRNNEPGGILNQCIHDGFGLHRYNESLTGPEYAKKVIEETKHSGALVLIGRYAKTIGVDDSEKKKVIAYTEAGIEEYYSKAIVLSTGCRERTRGAISIPGSRPAGVFTAGVAQNLINIKNVMIGRRVVILGSGDIGLIMARRLSLEGAKVMAVVEIMPEPCGLARNVSQCLYDFDIPLYVNSTVSKIIGKHKLKAVIISGVDENKRPIYGTEKFIECDALILSVGLIPENEVAETCGVELNVDNSVKTDSYLMTNIAGIFSCGNSRRVMDLADIVSEQGEMAGRNAVNYVNGSGMESWDESKTNPMKKGFPEEGSVTCTVCPNGCQIIWDEINKSFIGNKCKRGETFARQEKDNHLRVLTTTVKTDNPGHALIPVKGDRRVNKDDQIKMVKMAGAICVHGNYLSGQVVGRILDNDEKELNLIAT